MSNFNFVNQIKISHQMKNIYLSLLTFLGVTCFAQVGVGTTTPNGALDVSSSTNGFVPPRVALTATNVQAPVLNPQGGVIPAGTIVWNTATAGASPNNVAPGLYYWDGTRWVAFAGSPGGLDWSLLGNTATVNGTNFLGTIDDIGLDFRTNNTIRARIENSGRIGINMVPQTWAQTSSMSTDASIYAINGYALTDGGLGLYGRSQGAGGIGTYGRNDNTGGWGVYGRNSNTTSGAGTVGHSSGATGVGVVGLANGTTYSTLVGYAQGVAGTGQVGIYGMSTGTAATQRYGGYFSYDMDNNLATSDANSPHAMLAGRGSNFLGGDIYFGGYFEGGQDGVASTPNTSPDDNGNGNTGDFAYVGARWGGTNYKILGNGVVSTIIDGIDEKQHVMFAPESPEIVFQDYGVGKLNNGVAKIEIDPILAKNIVVNEKHPLKVFIQLEGDCNGVFVSNKSAKGFTVKELQNGTSNVNFSYQIVATRIDRKDNNGNVLSKNEDVRLPIAPGALPKIEQKDIQTKIIEDKEIRIEDKN